MNKKKNVMHLMLMFWFVGKQKIKCCNYNFFDKKNVETTNEIGS